ncbi:MAG TPA: DUF1905 domain-containing protein [Oceanospirillaceae bacterium]|mgnify:CR=1 FL=1|nr:DUF1905 domain-containing protein [Oceanospirillaceae bacterium]
MYLETSFDATVVKYQGKAAWYFASLPVDTSRWIKSMQSLRHGFGSVRVKVQIGQSEWQTSIFPDSKANTYVLPIKAAIRKQEGIDDGSHVNIHLQFEPN